MMTVNILGTEYRVETHKKSEDKFMNETNCDGYCSAEDLLIVVADMTEKKYFKYDNDNECAMYRNEVLRHEIVHAFLNESGLRGSTGAYGAWARNEEMVDWIAIQFPKMQKAFVEVGAL